MGYMHWAESMVPGEKPNGLEHRVAGIELKHKGCGERRSDLKSALFALFKC